MKYFRSTEHNVDLQNERLARAFYAYGRFIPYFLGVTGIGLIAIFILARSGVFGQPSPPLIYIGVSIVVLALVQIPLLELARRNKGFAATLLGSLATSIFAIILTCFWQGIYPVSIAICLIPPLFALRTGISHRYLFLLFLIVLFSIGGILYTENQITFVRLQNGTPASIASIAFLISTFLLLAVISIVSENKSFKRLQTLLLTSFIVIVTVPTILAAVLSAIGTYTNSQTQTLNTLQAITNLKVNQLEVLLEGFQNDAQELQIDPEFSRSALNVLTTSESDTIALENLRQLTRDHIESILGSSDQFKEVMVLNTQGQVLISTLSQNESLNFENQLFFRQGTLRFYTGFSDAAAFGEDNLIVATPIFDVDGRVIRGVLALRLDAASIKELMEHTPGFEEAETYLVDRNYQSITDTRTPAGTINTRAALDAILNNVVSGQGIYENYEKLPVLGYYEWFEPMQVAVIAEIPLSTVVTDSTRSLIGSAVLAVLIITIAITAVAISARSIVRPIQVLAQTTESFAAGKLSARAAIDREDEIGALAASYNLMASQLQEIIGKLEQRVNNRTRDLENQTQRLQMAAEIARDAGTARSLGELLDRAARLISDRFSFYHTGIYLIDKNREYAVLAASSSEAGRQMINNNHSVRVGGVGVIGWVADTGDPRIVFDNDKFTELYNSAELPNTHLEMVLPLKAENTVIGILDLHSDQLQAFGEEDIPIMQTMADQIATAIERTRLLQEIEGSLRELESAYGRYTREGWNRLVDTKQIGYKGYRFDNIELEPTDQLPQLEKDALKTGETISALQGNAARQNSVAIPIKLRGQTIGVISVKLKEEHRENTISTIELASERLASALESARLYEEARLRADREQSISQVATAISASTSYEDILQTTVREIGNTLRDAEVSIQILDDTSTRTT
jgi:GAF domain-containing protein/HAMP domain-containing protein